MKMQLTDAEVNHLRQSLAWIRLEYMLDEDMQRGFVSGIAKAMEAGYSSDPQANAMLAERAAKINHVPKYVRHAIKMLTKAIREHDGIRGDVVDAATRTVQVIESEQQCRT